MGTIPKLSAVIAKEALKDKKKKEISDAVGGNGAGSTATRGTKQDR